MEKEQIISTLKERIGQTSFSDRSLSDYVDNNLPTDGAEPDDAYWTKHTNILKSFGGQFSADVANTINAQIASKAEEYFGKNVDKLKAFLKAHPEIQIDGNTSTTVDKPNSAGEDPKMKALEDKINDLIKERDEAKNLQKVATLVNGVKGKADELKVTRKALWEDACDKVMYAEGDTDVTFLDKVKIQYASDLKRYYGDGEKPYQNSGNPGGGSGGNKAVSDYFAKKKAKMGKK